MKRRQPNLRRSGSSAAGTEAPKTIAALAAGGGGSRPTNVILKGQCEVERILGAAESFAVCAPLRDDFRHVAERDGVSTLRLQFDRREVPPATSANAAPPLFPDDVH